MKNKNHSWTDYLLLLPGLGFILFFIGSSIFVTICQSFGLFSMTGKSEFTLANWKILTDRAVFDSVVFSLKMGVLSSLGTLIFAYPTALFLRGGGKGTGVLGSLIKIPLFIPALVSAFLIVNLISYHGLVNEILLKLHIISEPLRMKNDGFGWGIVFIQIWKNLPFVLLIVSASLAGIRDDTIDAARNLGAGRMSILFRIMIPLSMPGILVSMILMFIKAFGDFPITSIAGPNYPSSIAFRMHTTATLFQEWDQAAVLGVLILITTLVVVWLYSKFADLIVKD